MSNSNTGLCLQPNGKEIPVTIENVNDYITEVLDAIIGKGVAIQVKAFREGFSKVFPVTDLRAFSADELVMLFGNSDEDWSIESMPPFIQACGFSLFFSALSEALKADHGFNVESKAIRDLVEIMCDYDVVSRRAFLQFITGSPKLPIGGMDAFEGFQGKSHLPSLFTGFRGLNPSLTVVRKPHEPPLKADDYLPSVMTCVNYLKLPEYSSKRVMEEKLKIAMQEGVGSFHLS